MEPPLPIEIEPSSTNGQPHLADAYNRHVAVVAFPFSSHASALLNTVRRLAAALPNTLFSFFSTSKSNSSLFSNNSINNMPRNIRVYDVADGVPEGYVFVGNPEEEIEFFMNAAPENLRRSLDASVADIGKQISCLITDAFLWFGVHLADDLGALWVTFWISGLKPLSVHVHTDLIRDTIGTQGAYVILTLTYPVFKVETLTYPVFKVEALRILVRLVILIEKAFFFQVFIGKALSGHK